MAGITKQIVGELAQSKTKGKEFEKEMWAKLKPEAIMKETPKTQAIKKKVTALA